MPGLRSFRWNSSISHRAQSTTFCCTTFWIALQLAQTSLKSLTSFEDGSNISPSFTSLSWFPCKTLSWMELTSESIQLPPCLSLLTLRLCRIIFVQLRILSFRMKLFPFPLCSLLNTLQTFRETVSLRTCTCFHHFLNLVFQGISVKSSPASFLSSWGGFRWRSFSSSFWARVG